MWSFYIVWSLSYIIPQIWAVEVLAFQHKTFIEALVTVMSSDISVIVMGWMTGFDSWHGQVPSFRHTDYTGSGAHPTSCVVNTLTKVVGTWGWLLTCTSKWGLECMEHYHHWHYGPLCTGEHFFCCIKLTITAIIYISRCHEVVLHKTTVQITSVQCNATLKP
jgi:hypothetical protein